MKFAINLKLEYLMIPKGVVLVSRNQKGWNCNYFTTITYHMHQPSSTNSSSNQWNNTPFQSNKDILNVSNWFFILNIVEKKGRVDALLPPSNCDINELELFREWAQRNEMKFISIPLFAKMAIKRKWKAIVAFNFCNSTKSIIKIYP
jgi:hypothetical protein